MSSIKSKDLMFIFIITSIYIMVISYPNLHFNKSIFEDIFLILLFLFSGYSLISVLRPEESYRDIFKKPVLLLEFSILLILSISIILKFFVLGLNLRNLTIILSIITLFLSIIAYIRRISNKPMQNNDTKKPINEKSINKSSKNDKAVIIANNVGMRFRLSQEKVDNLKEYVIKFLKREISYREFWAIRNVSFEVEKGNRWGIIGLNGAGKSTLLKIVSGVMKPTEGSIEIKGKIVPLLELGAGFDSNYTGKENIYLNGAMLGLSKEFLEDKYEEIVEFSEVRNFMNVPLKNYSSGMRARLGFAIATVIEPEILILDEVLSVGDAKFKRKSEKKIISLFKKGITVLFVSHSIFQVKRLCNKAIWLEKGKVVMVGDAKEVCDAYEKICKSEDV